MHGRVLRQRSAHVWAISASSDNMYLRVSMPLMCDQRHKNDADICCLKTQISPIHVYCTVAYCVVVQAPFALCQCTAVPSEASRFKQQPRKHWLTFACGMYRHSGSTSLLTIVTYAGSELSLCSIVILNVAH
jgi:hypothetical protein